MSGRETSARAIGIATLVLVITGCAVPTAQESRSPSVSAAATASATVEPTASPSRTQSPTPTEAPARSEQPSDRAAIAEVVTTDLVMRSSPGTGSESEIYSPSLSAPLLLYVLDGPVAADGYEWYRVMRFDEFPSDIGLEGPGVGWVASDGKNGEVWIAPWTGTCPSATAEDLMWRSQFVALACFGDRELTLEGNLGDCVDTGHVDSPSGFGYCLLAPFGAPPGRLLAGFTFYVQSAPTDVDAGMAVRVTGHYDDAAAMTCATNAWPADDPPPELKVLYCRAKFVATEITPTSAP